MAEEWDAYESYIEGEGEKMSYQAELEFAEAVKKTRGEPGVTIRKIAEIFKEKFDSEEMKLLIKLLSQ